MVGQFLLHCKVMLRHTYKLAVGLPVLILVASTLSLMRSDQAIGLVCEDTRYVEEGAYFALDVVAESASPINAVSGTVHYPTNFVSFVESGTDDTIIDLWTETPATTTEGSLKFSGGIVAPAGFSGEGSVIHMTFKALKVGTARFSIEDGHMLAHDGAGTEVLSAVRPITVIVRRAGTPSPDVNSDARVTLVDVGIVSARLFGSYETRYDLNRDGKITLADLSIIFAQFVNGSRLGSLVLAYTQ